MSSKVQSHLNVISFCRMFTDTQRLWLFTIHGNCTSRKHDKVDVKVFWSLQLFFFMNEDRGLKYRCTQRYLI